MRAKTGTDRKAEAEGEHADDDRARLPGDRKPAQADEGVEAQTARLPTSRSGSGENTAVGSRSRRPASSFDLLVGVHAPESVLFDIALETVAVDQAPRPVAFSQIDDHARLKRGGEIGRSDGRM